MITCTLVDASGGTLLTLGRDTSGAVLNTLDLGYPSVRATTTPLSGQDGDYDVTTLMGSRAIVAEVTLPPSGVGPLMDTVRGLMHPGRRYWLRVARDDWPAARQILVRGATLAQKSGALPVTAQLGWSAPVPTFQAVTASTATLNPSAPSAGGMSFPVTFPLSLSPGLVSGASILTVDGNTNAPFTLDIYGPCTDPLFRVVDTGKQLQFRMTVAAGDYLHVDTAARTITLNNDPNQSAYNRLDFSVSQWPSLPPGSPQVVYSPGSSSPPSNAVVSWRSTWL